jgi:hypothetical protein
VIDERQKAIAKMFLFDATSIRKFFMCVNNNFLQDISAAYGASKMRRLQLPEVMLGEILA